MNTVFVVMDGHGKNLLPAKEYGELRVMLTGRETTEKAKGKLHGALTSMKDNDYLLLIGNPLFIGLAVHIAKSAFEIYSGAPLKCLIWNPVEYKYYVETI
jgi:hypothetical protein